MGGSLRIWCKFCGLDCSVLYGPGMIGIEQVPAVCVSCERIVVAQRVWEPVRADKDHAQYLRAEFELGDDDRLVCPDCSADVQAFDIVQDDTTGAFSIGAPCPTCGHQLEAEDGNLLWD